MSHIYLSYRGDGGAIDYTISEGNISNSNISGPQNDK